jgi:hypothetical protein
MKKEILFLLAGMTLLFPSCEKEEGLEASGEKVRVRFVFKASPYGEHETLRRNSDGTSLPLETVEIPLGDNRYLDVSLVADPVSPARDGASVLSTDSKVRIIAYKNNTFAKSVEYTYTADGLEGDDLELEQGNYTFVAYSHNSSMETLAYGGDDTEKVTVSPPKDWVWGKTDEPVAIDGTEKQVSLSLDHLFSRVKYSTSITGATLDHLTASLVSNYEGELTKESGNLAKGGTATAQSLRENDYDIVYTGGENSFSIRISGDVIGPTATVTFSNRMVKFNKKLAPGGSYTLQVNFRKEPAWARSNIYWDAALNDGNGGLTFVPHGSTKPEDVLKQNYQGVFFRWGSLWGVTPKSPRTKLDWADSSKTVYRYKKTGETGAWESATVAIWDDNSVPWYKEGTSNARSKNYFFDDGAEGVTGSPVLDADDGTYYTTGDICRLIGAVSGNPDLEGYRLPTSYEFDNGRTSTEGMSLFYFLGTVTDGWFINPSSGWGTIDYDALYSGLKDDGTYPIAWGIKMSDVPFPTSGCRLSGSLSFVGFDGDYWSGSVSYRTSTAYYLSFGSQTVSTADDEWCGRAHSYSVRCVKN